MKKIISMIMILYLLTSSVSASIKPSLYAYTTVNEKADEYLLENLDMFADALGEKVEVGHGVALYNSDEFRMYYPIIVNGIIKNVIEVYNYNGEFGAACSSFMVEDFIILSSLSSKEYPIKLMYIDNKILAQTKQGVYDFGKHSITLMNSINSDNSEL